MTRPSPNWSVRRVALNLIEKSKRGANEDAFVNSVLARVAERVWSEDLDGGARAIDAALAEFEAGTDGRRTRYSKRGSRSIRCDVILVSVARRIEMIVAVANHRPTGPAWLPEFRERTTHT